MWAITVKEFLQLRRDKRTVAMLLMLPLLFLVIFGYAASFDVKEVTTVVTGPAAPLVQSVLPSAFRVVATRPDDDRADAVEALRQGEAIAAIVTPAAAGSRPELLVDGTQIFAARAAQVAAASAANASDGQTPGIAQTLKVSILFNPDLRTSVIMVPGLCGIILVFIGTVATVLGVVRERAAGTLEQLAVMPFRGADVFLGKIAPYLLIAAFDMVVIVAAGLLIFDVPFRGSPATFALGALLFLFVTLGVGVLVSTVSQTQGQAIQLAMMTLLPQILLSGLFFPLYSVAIGVRWLGYVLPLTYFIEIARGVMVRGTSITALWLPFLMLAALSVLVFGGAVLRFRHDLAPAGRAARSHSGSAEPPVPEPLP